MSKDFIDSLYDICFQFLYIDKLSEENCTVNNMLQISFANKPQKYDIRETLFYDADVDNNNSYFFPYINFFYNAERILLKEKMKEINDIIKK